MKTTFYFLLIIACAMSADVSTDDNSNPNYKPLPKDNGTMVQVISGTSTAAPSLDAISSNTPQPGNSDLSTSANPNDNMPCTKQYVPVCGNNGQTYNNPCEFKNAQKLDPNLKRTNVGSCKT